MEKHKLIKELDEQIAKKGYSEERLKELKNWRLPVTLSNSCVKLREFYSSLLLSVSDFLKASEKFSKKRWESNKEKFVHDFFICVFADKHFSENDIIIEPICDFIEKYQSSVENYLGKETFNDLLNKAQNMNFESIR